jgi:hypothetical protein
VHRRAISFGRLGVFLLFVLPLRPPWDSAFMMPQRLSVDLAFMMPQRLSVDLAFRFDSIASVFHAFCWFSFSLSILVRFFCVAAARLRAAAAGFISIRYAPAAAAPCRVQSFLVVLGSSPKLAVLTAVPSSSGGPWASMDPVILTTVK